MARMPAVYIVANKRNGTLYTGVTSDLIKRVWEHKHGDVPGFTKRHQLHSLVYFELGESMYDAIAREKQIKSGSRQQQLDLIESTNPDWLDLYDQIIG